MGSKSTSGLYQILGVTLGAFENYAEKKTKWKLFFLKTIFYCVVNVIFVSTELSKQCELNLLAMWNKLYFKIICEICLLSNIEN